MYKFGKSLSWNNNTSVLGVLYKVIYAHKIQVNCARRK